MLLPIFNWVKWIYVLQVVLKQQYAEAGIGGFNALNALSKRNDDPKPPPDHLMLIEMVSFLGDGGELLYWKNMSMLKQEG